MTIPLSNFRAVKELPTNIFQTPTLLEGPLGESVYTRYIETRRDTYQDNPNLRLQYSNGVVTGSNLFDVLLIDEITKREIQGAPRTSRPRDLSDPRILEMVRGKHYIDSRSLALRSMTDSVNPRNNGLIQTLIEQGDIDVSRLRREPALLEGFDLELDQNDKQPGYGLKLVPNAEFTVIYDDRLLAKWDGSRFNNVDELGLPIFDKNGSRTWHAREDGLSRLDLDRGLYLDSDWDGLDYSDSGGRVVVVGGEATTQNFSEPTKEQ